MPQVPRYDGGVGERPLPNIRVDPTAPIEAFGGGEGPAAVAEQVRAVAIGAHSVFQEQQQRADATRLSEERRALNDWEYSNIYDPKTGAANRVGVDGLKVSEDLRTAYDQFTGERSTKLTPSQRAAYKGMTDARRVHIMNWAGEHTAKQIRIKEVGEKSAAIESGKDRASWNPFAKTPDGRTAADLEADILRDNVAELAKLHGLGPEATKDLLRKHETDFHGRNIKFFMNGKDYQGAKLYYDKWKDYIASGVQQEAQAAITHESYRDGALQIEQWVFPARDKKTAEALAEKELEKRGWQNNPEARKVVQAQIEARWKLQEDARNEAHRAAIKEGTILIEGKNAAGLPNTWRDIPSHIWINEYSIQERGAFMHYSELKNTTPKIETDRVVMAAFKVLAYEKPKEFMDQQKTNFFDPKWRAKLSPKDLEELVDLQLKLKNDDATAKAKVNEWRSTDARVSGRMARLKIKDDAAKELFRESFDVMYGNQAEANEGKPVTPDQVDAILNRLTSQAGWSQRGIAVNRDVEDGDYFFGHLNDKLWTDAPKFGYQGVLESRDQMARAVQRLDAGERSEIEADLQARGRRVTPANILDLHRQRLNEKTKGHRLGLPSTRRYIPNIPFSEPNQPGRPEFEAPPRPPAENK